MKKVYIAPIIEEETFEFTDGLCESIQEVSGGGIKVYDEIINNTNTDDVYSKQRGSFYNGYGDDDFDY